MGSAPITYTATIAHPPHPMVIFFQINQWKGRNTTKQKQKKEEEEGENKVSEMNLSLSYLVKQSSSKKKMKEKGRAGEGGYISYSIYATKKLFFQFAYFFSCNNFNNGREKKKKKMSTAFFEGLTI